MSSRLPVAAAATIGTRPPPPLIGPNGPAQRRRGTWEIGKMRTRQQAKVAVWAGGVPVSLGHPVRRCHWPRRPRTALVAPRVRLALAAVEVPEAPPPEREMSTETAIVMARGSPILPPGVRSQRGRQRQRASSGPSGYGNLGTESGRDYHQFRAALPVSTAWRPPRRKGGCPLQAHPH